MKTYIVSLLFIAGANAAIIPGSKNLGAIWCIGDSITQSNADGDANGSPRKALHSLLIANGYTFTFTGSHNANTDGFNPATQSDYLYHSGYSGSVISNPPAGSGRVNMTASLPTHWAAGKLATVKPNVILIMLGTNDVDQRASSGLTTAQMATNLQNYITSIFQLPSAGNPTVFVSTIAPNNTQAGDNDAVISFNAQLPGIVANLKASGKDVHLVDSNSALNGNYAANMMGDNLHPNATGNQTIAQQWFQGIQAIVKPATPTVMGVNAAADTNNTPAAGMAIAAKYSSEILNNDLIDASSSTWSGATLDKNPALGTAALLNNGLGHPSSGTPTGVYFPATLGTGDKLPFTYTAQLDTINQPGGYTITEIRSYAGWNQNGAALANQKYEVQVRTVSGSSFVSLGTFEYSPFENTDSREAGASRMTITPADTALARGVTAIRFIAMNHGRSNGAADGTVYHEFDVLGQPTPTFAAWATHHQIPINENDDSDHDGLPALVEYALGSDPKSTTPNPLPQANADNLRITWPKGDQAIQDPMIAYDVKVSANLVDWEEPAPAAVENTGNLISLHLSSGQPRLFARLGITRSSP